MALFSKVFSCLSKSRVTIRRCYSGNSCPPPGLAVEELKDRHGFGPWLMFADAENDKRDSASGGFRRCYSFSSDEIFSLPAPQLQGRRCWGTQYGWLITFGPDGAMDLINTLTHRQLPLPSRTTIRSSHEVKCDRLSFFKSFALSSNPSDSDSLVVMSTYGGCCQLAFSAPGDEAWKHLDDSGPRIGNFDTIFYRGQFYSFDCQGNLKVCDITSGKPTEKLITTLPNSISFSSEEFYPEKKKFSSDEFYLVEISGDLHLICRIYNPRRHNEEVSITVCFDIFRFDFQKTEWVAIEDLNGHTLFVGNNIAFAISATDYPNIDIEPNCIYFTNDLTLEYELRCEVGCYNMGIYDFATKDISICKLGKSPPYEPPCKPPCSSFSRPFFFIPSI